MPNPKDWEKRLNGPGVMKVIPLGGDGQPADEPEIALGALDIFEEAFEAAGGTVDRESPVKLVQPDGGLRLIRGSEEN